MHIRVFVLFPTLRRGKLRCERGGDFLFNQGERVFSIADKEMADEHGFNNTLIFGILSLCLSSVNPHHHDIPKF